MKTIFVFNAEDGDNIAVIAKAGISVSDPAGAFKGVARTFRLVSNTYGPTLSLVALAPSYVLSELPRSTYSERRQNLLSKVRQFDRKNLQYDKKDFITLTDFQQSGFHVEEFIFSRHEIEETGYSR